MDFWSWENLEACVPWLKLHFLSYSLGALGCSRVLVESVVWDWGEAALLSLIGSLQRQNGPGQRVIREVNTTTRACALWGLAEDSDYTVQVRSIGLRGESPPGPRVHFRTLKGSDRLPSNSSSPGEGLSYSPTS